MNILFNQPTMYFQFRKTDRGGKIGWIIEISHKDISEISRSTWSVPTKLCAFDCWCICKSGEGKVGTEVEDFKVKEKKMTTVSPITPFQLRVFFKL